MGDLLSANLASQVAAWGLSIRGKIDTRQTCPACGQRGQYHFRDFGRGRRALVCECGGHIGDRLELVVKWRGTTYRLTHDESGQRFTDYVHAERGLGAVNNQIERKAFYPELWRSARQNKLLWENYLTAYLEAEQRRLLPKRLATWHKKRVMIQRLMSAFPGQNIREIRTAQIEDYANSPDLRASLAPKSVANLLAELGHIFVRAVAREDIERAPKVPAVEVPRKVLRYMTQAQQAHVLEHIPDQHLPLFMFLMDYGVWVGEACALCWDKLDLAQQIFVVARRISRRWLSSATKTRRENSLPIVGWFAGYLQGVPVGIGETPVFRNPQADPRRNAGPGGSQAGAPCP